MTKSSNIFTDLIDFLKTPLQISYLIKQLIKHDYRNRYIGSMLGFVWTIIQPITMVLILWLVFAKAFKIEAAAEGVPFVIWLTVGIIAWNFFAEALTVTTNVFQEYAYLVKKLKFKIAILPLIKIASSLVTHLIFIGISISLIFAFKIEPSLFWLQSIYYLFALLVLLTGLGLLTASLNVFSKDTNQIVNISLQFGFWLTPIFWDLTVIPQNLQSVLQLNPLFYIVEGYRNSFLYSEGFWTTPQLTIYFWSITLITFFLGFFLFRKLQPHFADVL